MGFSGVSAVAKACAAAAFTRASGTRYFIAACALRLPARICSWIEAGKACSSASRPLTQLLLCSKRRASSSSDH